MISSLAYELLRSIFKFPKSIRIKDYFLLLTSYLIFLRSETMVCMRMGFFEIYWDLHYNLVHDHLVGWAVNVPTGYRILHMFIKLDLFCSTCLIFSNFLSAYTINNWKKYVISPLFFLNSILYLDYTYQYSANLHRLHHIFFLNWSIVNIKGNEP